MKDYEVALFYFTKAIELDGDNKIFFSNRCACYLAKGVYKLALKDAMKCIEIDSDFVKGYYRASLAYYEMGLLNEASDIIKKYQYNGKEEGMDCLVRNINEKKDEYKMMKKSNIKLCNNLEFKTFDKYLQFTKWLYDGEAIFSKLDIHFYSDNHRGVLAKQNLFKDEIILTIPLDLLISLEVAKSTDLGAKIASIMYSELNSPKHCLLTSYILNEKFNNPNSKWSNYLNILPQDYSNFPVFFTDHEIKLLEGSPFKSQVEEKKKDILKDYEKICSLIPEFKMFTYKDFSEIRMAVSSRIFGVKINGKKTDVLAPFADLLNHKRPRQTHWTYDEKYAGFIIQALENIQQGEEVFDSYGKKCNSRFLLNYGFILENNDSNEFPVIISLDESHPLHQEKKEILNYETYQNRKFKLQENLVDYGVIDFFSFLRFTHFDGDINILYKVFII